MSHHLLYSAALLVMLVFVASSGAQEPSPPQPTPELSPRGSGRVRVYLDCGDDSPDRCFSTYLRDEIKFVDFVRQPQDAEVHLLASAEDTGGGGREVVLRLVGRGRFEGHDHDLKVITLAADTESTRREFVLRTVTVGLLDYVAHDGIPPDVAVSVRTEPREAQPAAIKDRWNLWVYSIQIDGSVDADAGNRERAGALAFTADRVTEAWKLSVGAEIDENIETFDLDGDEPFEVTRRENEVEWFVAKSLGPNWSAGFQGQVSTSTFDNIRFSTTTSPAVEFNVFPYKEYATRQLRLQYQFGFERAAYNEVTIFNKLEETLWRHEASADLDQRQPWGSLSAGLEFSQYLHDSSKYRLEGEGSVDLRLARGFSLNIGGSASRIRDQLSLPLRDATDEEVLLRIRQIQTGYDMRFNVGVKYTFGSLFNNIVNPRFGN